MRLFLPLLFSCQRTLEGQDVPIDTGEGGPFVFGDDTGAGEDTGQAEAGEVSDLSWALHETVKSLVWASWNQSEEGAVHVEFSFDGDEVHSTPAVSGSGAHTVLIAGIPYGTTADWAAVSDGGDRWEGSPISTGSFPSSLPVPELLVSTPDAWLPGGNYLLLSMNSYTGGWTGGVYWAVIMDREARVVWAQMTPMQHWTLYSQVAVTGDYLLWDEATYWSDWDDGAGSTVHLAWLDAEISEVSTPGLHHAFVQLPDGSLAWGSQDHGGGEALVEMPLAGGDQTVIWTCEDDWGGERSCESNCLWYSEERDSYLYSFYTNNSVVEVDRGTGASLWWAGEKRGGYSFADGTPQFDWQHGVTWTDAGTLLVSSRVGRGGSTSTWAYEYVVDRAAEQLNIVWSSDSRAYAETNGDTWRLSNGNTLHVMGSSGELREVDAEGADVWRVAFDGKYLLGRGELIEDLYNLVSPTGRGEASDGGGAP